MNIKFLHWQNLPFLWYILCNFSYSKSTHHSWKYETNCNWVFFFWTQCRYIYSGPKLYTLVVSCVLWTTETRELDKFDQEWGEAREELWLFHWRQHSI